MPDSAAKGIYVKLPPAPAEENDLDRTQAGLNRPHGRVQQVGGGRGGQLGHLVWVVFVVVEDVVRHGRPPRGGVRVSRTLEP